MAIANPASMILTVQGQLTRDCGNGRVNSTQLLNDTTTINFTAYSQGSVEITSASDEVSLGKYSVAFISSAAPITVKTIDGATVNTQETKLFALNGNVNEIIVSTTSILPITVQYIAGTSASV
jgi:hypothetical protein